MSASKIFPLQWFKALLFSFPLGGWCSERKVLTPSLYSFNNSNLQPLRQTTLQGRRDDGQGETFEAPWVWAPPKGGLSACAQHQLEGITPVIVGNSSGKGKAGRMKRDGRKEPARFFFRNGSGRDTGKVYNTYPGSLAWKEIACVDLQW